MQRVKTPASHALVIYLASDDIQGDFADSLGAEVLAEVASTLQPLWPDRKVQVKTTGTHSGVGPAPGDHRHD